MSFGQKQGFFCLLCLQFFIGLSIPLPIVQENGGLNTIQILSSGSGSSALKHYVSLQVDGSHRCAAVLLNKHIALAAAHCLYDLEKNPIDRSRLKMVAGVQKRDDVGAHTQTGAVENISIHPHFNINSNTHENDIALIRLRGNGFNLEENENVHKVHVVSPTARNFTGATAVTSGFSGSRDKLKHFQTRVISNFICNQILTDGNGIRIGVSSSMICTHVSGQSAVCLEDQGAPLIHLDGVGRRKIIGIAAREGNCAQNRPSVFTRISKFEGWIQNKYNELVRRVL